jgi:PAS domain S-box-containing protein
LLNTVKTATSRIIRVFTGTSFVIAVFAVIGYAYGATGLVGIPTLSPIALYSAITILVLCVGIAAVDPTGVFVQLLTSDASGSAAARTLLPLSVVVLPILGWLEIHVGPHGLYSAETGTALLVLLSTVVLVLGVLSLTKRLTRLDRQRRTGATREVRLAALVDAASDAILSCDTDGIITSWNRAAEQLYGYTEQEMVGQALTQLTPPTQVAEHRQMLKAVARGESRNDVEIQSIHKNGSLLDLSVTISKIVNDDSLVGFCGVAHSNSERLRARDELEERVLERTSDLVTSRAETLQMLARAAEYRDDDTAQHTERVGESAARLADQFGLPSALVELIGQAAPLHDVGKIAIPDRILLKPGVLTAEEFEAIKRHTVLGANLLAGSGAEVLKLGEQIALTHHERWDGNGYPNQLAGDAIPIAGRIVAVVGQLRRHDKRPALPEGILNRGSPHRDLALHWKAI